MDGRTDKRSYRVASERLKSCESYQSTIQCMNSIQVMTGKIEGRQCSRAKLNLPCQTTIKVQKNSTRAFPSVKAIRRSVAVKVIVTLLL